MSTILITGGTVVNATGTAQADVLVDGETIAAVLAPGSQLLGHDLAASVDTVIDATGKLVIPGGIDAHTHMELPFGGTNASDTFETGTRAAAWGGTTSIIDFAVQRYGERVEDGLAAWHAKAAGNCAIDYGFHQIIGGVDEFSLKAMDSLIDEGITSFKLFMAYPGVFYSDDAQILKAMQKSAETGLLTMMHAENGPAIDVLAEQLYSAGKTGPYWHGIARAWQLEEEATHRAIMIADVTGAPLYVVHVSAQQAVAQIAAARDRGRNVFGETCPQYLYLSLEDQLGASSDGVGRLRGGEVGLLDPAALPGRGPPGRDVAGAAHQRPADGLHRPLPVLHEGAEGAGPGRLPRHPQRHRQHRAPDGPALPGRGHRRAHPAALGGDHLDHPGPDVRSVRPQGRHPARGGCGPRDLRPERPHLDRRRRRPDPPHEHGPLRLGGLRDRRPRRPGAVARHR